MRVLVYQFQMQHSGAISYDVHVSEILEHLSEMGNILIFAGGKYYESVKKREAGTVPEPLSVKSFRTRMKDNIRSWPIRGEIGGLNILLAETRLFLSALKTVFLHKPELIYRRHNVFSSEDIISRLFKIPVVREVNGLIVDETRISNRGSRLSLKVLDVIERLSIKRKAGYIAVTNNLRDILSSDYGIPRDRIEVIENGANTDIFRPGDLISAKSNLGLEPRISYLCFTRMFSRWQGIENLIKAVPKVLNADSDVKVLLVGDGEMKSELQDLAKQLNVSENVVFTGKVAYDRVPEYINACEICVVPKKPLRSGYSPLKLYEYMACEKPVIATRTEGFEVLEEQNAGLLINPESADEFSQAIIRLLRDPDLRQQMGSNARKFVLENRSWESVARRVDAVFRQSIKTYNSR